MSAHFDLLDLIERGKRCKAAEAEVYRLRELLDDALAVLRPLPGLIAQYPASERAVRAFLVRLSSELGES